MVQEYQKELEKLREENRKLSETHNEKIKELEEEIQALEGAAMYSAKALEVLNAERVCLMDCLSALLFIIMV